MNIFMVNYFDKHRTHSVEIRAKSKYDAQKQIERDFPTAYDIYVWSPTLTFPFDKFKGKEK